ncbi:rho guanine nucleotide exchange factor 17 isoform X2 [Sarcophilus harrisii]|uniref:rho guanine nucleotide exchange factor 17 isoform X2 n=1 Tax=Sarcophilus harrisii TaxID=9305 RepID=UPI001301C9C4|nr:rho guanine nucleotide exchange factor 17 isoform X2 [Sarcophilus harrisii]
MTDGPPPPPLYRSISFKRLERWSGGPGCDRADCAEETPSSSPGLRRRAPGTTTLAASRRVSKLASGSTGAAATSSPRPLRSLSPSVRQLSQRFDCAGGGSRSRSRSHSQSLFPGTGSPNEEEAHWIRGREGAPSEFRRGQFSAEEGAGAGAGVGGGGPGSEPTGHWPSVTEMRKLFGGQSFRRPSPDGLWSSSPASASPTRDDGAQSPEEPPGRQQPPPPPPRTCFPLSGLRSPLPRAQAEGRRQQQADSSHSWHSYCQPHAGPQASVCSSSSSPATAFYPVSRSLSRGESSSEEEEQAGAPGICAAPSPGAQPSGGSGSEGDGLKEEGILQASSYRKEASAGGWDLDNDGLKPGRMDSPEQIPEDQGLNSQGPGCGTEGLQSARGSQEGLRQLSRGLPESFGSTFPMVSRVAKVSFPPYVASLGRHSSTEKLREEDLWTGRGSWGLYRSPSFGTGDGFLRPQAHARPKPLVCTGKGQRDRPNEAVEPSYKAMELEKSRQRKSLSNPDIASETLTLLSFLRSDLSELKVRRSGRRPGDQDGTPQSCGDATEDTELTGHQGSLLAPGRQALGTRPTLKDLTATLRRAKSFSCSEGPSPRRLSRTGALKPSSSELLLARRRAEEEEEEEGLPEVVQDQYVQEAQQVFEKISQMGARRDEGGSPPALHLPTSSPCRRSLEELSGHESSLTDEGIVTEPEPASIAYRGLGPLSEWKSGEFPLSSSRMNPSGPPAEGGWASPTGPLDAPGTPGALRRRRKAPPLGPGGTDLSNGDASEAYRSLSDPMPHHRRPTPLEESSGFSVDSNLLGSLGPKAGLPPASAVALADCGAAGASDSSIGSDGGKDFQEVIQSVVHQPGALGRAVDERVHGRAAKKKSLSDPSRRGEQASPGFEGPGGEPILEAALPPASSEPILLEHQSDEPGKTRAQSERVLPKTLSATAPLDFHLDPKLADVLSPRLARRSSKKRPARSSHQELRKEEDTAPLGRAQPGSRHVRHASEPAAFIPIEAPEPIATGTETSGSANKVYPALQVPSLEDVTKQYMLTLRTSEAPAGGPTDVSQSTPATPTSSEAKPPEAARPPEEPIPTERRQSQSKPQVDMRKHVIMTLLDTEQSYVESLRTLMQGYMQPLKQPENAVLCDPSLVDEIFNQIPELLEHHEQFLEQVQNRVQEWHTRQKVGDLLVQSFSKDILVNIYSAYIDNFLNAKDAVRIAKEARPAFLKFLEQSMRENKEKQALSDLMIKPVQRIPRYELLVKDLLKHTPEEHPDRPFLIDAHRNIKQVAEKINKGMKNAEEVERHARVLLEIEAHIEGMEDLQAPLRRFLRQEMVVEKAVGGKKDRSLFLFSDLLVCTTLKRKSGSLRRSSMSLYTAASVIDIASKYKLLWKLPLEDADIIKGASHATNRESVQKAISHLDEDLNTLGQISKLSESLSFPHQSLDDVIKELTAAAHRDLAEKQALCYTLSFPPNKVELSATRPEGTDTFIFEFPHPDARVGFEQAFDEAKRKLASSKNCLDPEFLKAIPIMKTRSGMQFSCASPSHSTCAESAHEVWVCNSDGYVGQVCLLSLRAEPTVEACIAVCSARILCMGSVPGLQPGGGGGGGNNGFRDQPPSLVSPACPPEVVTTAAALEEGSSQPCLHISISGSSPELPPGPANSTPGPELMPFDSDDSDDESSPSPSGTLQSQASRSTISSSFGNEEMPSSKEATAETTSSEEEPEPGFLPLSSSFGPSGPHGGSPVDGRALRRSSRGSFTRGSLEDLLSMDPEAYQSSMWLGTEDGCIHVYQSSDSIRNRKNSMKLQHTAAVTAIMYLDNQVFVSLANGELVVYNREAGHFWDPQNSKSLVLGSPGNPVTKMVSVSGKLWCGCQNRIFVLNTGSLQQEHTFQVGLDPNRSVACMVNSSLGVWIALHSTAQVRLYHSGTFEQLAEVDITPPVHKMLAGSDAIIRQHKAACLRITALLACEDLLWIGTSAGVVLTMPTSPNTVSTPRAPLSPAGLVQGHTGHVRFLTAIELPDNFDLLCPPPSHDASPEKPPLLERRDSSRHRGSAPAPAKPKMLVISGGDGYEDFRLSGSSSETVGRDDSTNHLLLWRV